MPDDLSGFSRSGAPTAPAEQSSHQKGPSPLLLPKPFTYRAPALIPPREWLMSEMLCRKFLTVIAAAGGRGKTSLNIAWALALATGKPLTGHHTFGAVPVWLFNLEDPEEEFERRIGAAMMHFGIAPEQVEGKLFVHTGRERSVCIAKLTDGRGEVVYPDEKAIVAGVRQHGIGAVIVDPFISSHELGENDNTAMDKAAKAWARVGNDGNCAVAVSHHQRKGTDTPGDASSTRGASSLVDASRITRTLSGMSPQEAEQAGIGERERRFYVRLDDGKLNIALSGETRWFKLASVNLGNGTAAYPNGDNIQVVEPWQPPSSFAGLTDCEVNTALDAIEAGPKDGVRYTRSKTGTAKRWAGSIVMDRLGRNEEQAKAILAAWIKSGLVFERAYDDAEQRKERMGLFVDGTRRPGR